MNCEEPYPRKPQQKHYRAPRFPGTAAFDLRNGLSELPNSKRKANTLSQSSLPQTHLNEQFNFDVLDSDGSNKSLGRSLGPFDGTSSSNRLMSIPHPPFDSMPEGHNDSLPGNTIGLPPSLDNTVPNGPSDHDLNLLELGQPAPKKLCAISQPCGKNVEQLLAVELRDISAEPMDKEKYPGLNARIKSINRCLPLSDSQFEALIALYRNLLSGHHDFFEATQHPSPSLAFRSLATKYAMPEEMWYEAMPVLLRMLRRLSPHLDTHMTRFGDLCREMMEKFIENVPQLINEWDLVKDNLKKYFVALHADGFRIPPSVLQCYGNGEIGDDLFRRTSSSPLKGHFFGDDDLPDWFIKAYLPNGFWEYSKDAKYEEVWGADSLHGMAELMMTGWMLYGRKIATSYHAYCQVFIFLAVTTHRASFALF